MAILGRSTRPGQARVAAALQTVQRVAHDRVVVFDDRLAIGRLIARQTQRVQRQRVVVGRGALLLEQAAKHTDLRGGQVHQPPSYDPPAPDATAQCSTCWPISDRQYARRLRDGVWHPPEEWTPGAATETEVGGTRIEA